jgi:hypothetical protein
MNREFLDMVMEALADISRRLDTLESEMATGEVEPAPPHSAGPNVIRFPTRREPGDA